MIPVTKSFLPPLEEYTRQVQRAYDNGWLTNRGELVRELESNLSAYLQLNESQVLCTNNGTIPLQIALKVLAEKGEVITTPFSYVATTASIVWEGCTPVFVDIDPESLTIDPTKIEEAITSKTKCILATHVYGNPCDIESIDHIAKKHNLKVIYDAAHCFGVMYKGRSIFEYGDVSTCSFHATKLFHTGEGGALFCSDEELFNQLYFHHNFGHDGTENYHGLGINGKMSELNAAMGLAVLPYMEKILINRKRLVKVYTDSLQIERAFQSRKGTEENFSYFPILVESEPMVHLVMEELKKMDIYLRRYFYPSLTDLPYVRNKECPIALDRAKRVLCLPLYPQLEYETAKRICDKINELC